MNGFSMKHTRIMYRQAFSLVELLVVIAIIGLLAALYLPAAARAKSKAVQIQCLSNLKQIGLSFHVFADDHEGRYPMQVSARNGGSLEFVAGGNAFRHFQCLSNLLSDPRVVLCPADKAKLSGHWPTLSNDNVSYFVGLDASSRKPNNLLCGDRNITNQTVVTGPVMSLTTNDVAGWTANIHNKSGNLLFVDGRVERTDDARLQEALRQHSLGKSD